MGHVTLVQMDWLNPKDSIQYSPVPLHTVGMGDKIINFCIRFEGWVSYAYLPIGVQPTYYLGT